jgi:hypothetical protein
MALPRCPVCGSHRQTCGPGKPPGPGVIVVDKRHLARERIYYTDEKGRQRLAFAEGQPIPAADAKRLNIVSGRVRHGLPDPPAGARKPKKKRKT